MDWQRFSNPIRSRADSALWSNWRSSVNMTASELRRFLKTEEGQAAGTKTGQQSARRLLEMIPKGGRSFRQAQKNWTTPMWVWAQRQVSFIARMSKSRGPLYDNQGRKTRKHLALLLWGHDPTRRNR